MSKSFRPKFVISKYRPDVPVDESPDEPLDNVVLEPYVSKNKTPVSVALYTRLPRRLPVLTAEPLKPAPLKPPAVYTTQGTQTEPVVFYDDVKLRLPVAIVKPPAPLRATAELVPRAPPVQQTPAKEVFFLSNRLERTYNLGAGPVYNRTAWNNAMDTAEEQRQRKIKADKAMLVVSVVL